MTERGGETAPRPGEWPSAVDPGFRGGAPPSSVPKVVGILMIVFASLGLLAGLYRLGTLPSGELPGALLRALRRYRLITEGIGLSLSVVHLLGGILAVGYRRKAPHLATLYGAATVAMNLIGVVLYAVMVAPELKAAGGALGGAAANLTGAVLIGQSLVLSIWPTLVLILMNLEASRAACRGQG